MFRKCCCSLMVKAMEDRSERRWFESRHRQGLSSDIQNDIISSISEYMYREIKKDVSQAPFVAVILDETTDISTKSQLSTVIRYVNIDGSIEERFLGFRNISEDRSANALAQHVFNTLMEFDCEKKLVAQTYDGAAVMAGQHSGLQVRVREKCPQAMFVHCHAHRLNLVQSQAVSYIKRCKIFFITLTGFGTFFSKSTKRTEALDTEIRKRFPSLAPTRWNYSSRFLETVYEYKIELRDLFVSINENSDKWDSDTIIFAAGLLSKLQDFDFNFLLVVFASIFPHSDALFQVLQKKILDISFCIKSIDNFTAHLTRLREDFDSIWCKTEIVTSQLESDLLPTNRTKRARLENVSGDDRKSLYRRLFFEIIDVMNANINHRFSDISKLKLLPRLDVRNFHNFEKKFPEDELSNLKESYGNFFDFPKLRSELSVLYKEPHMHKESIVELYSEAFKRKSCCINPRRTSLPHTQYQCDCARDNGISIVCLTPHSTAKLQPLDVAFMFPFKRFYGEAIKSSLSSDPGRVITNLQLSRLFNYGYIKAATIEMAVNGFRKTDIVPYNPNIFSDVDFVVNEAEEIATRSQQVLAISP
ncbi:hypothetical protein ANN_27034 [Periplaneta americana]|uniref:DUF4371 domain-containing protein n=1 Tax=Periplaneta americana TaxID=6978 RepID=A0ABQ8RWX3_PERAM|nr:hypothetical protein ANN_27034 [Periplaneta americana]